VPGAKNRVMAAGTLGVMGMGQFSLVSRRAGAFLGSAFGSGGGGCSSTTVTTVLVGRAGFAGGSARCHPLPS
jgi:hypothetical protein